MHWVFQGVLTSLLAAFLWLGAASLLTWFRTRWPKYGDFILYWLGSAVLIGLLWFVVVGHPPFFGPPPVVDADNVETDLRQWTDDLGLSIAKQEQLPPDASFGYIVTTKDGVQINIDKPTKEKANYLQFIVGLSAPADIQAMMTNLTQEQRQTLTDEMGAELNRERIGFTFSTASAQMPTGPLNTVFVTLQKGTYIPDLNEQRFSQDIDDLNFTVNLVRVKTKLLLKSMVALKSSVAVGKSVTQN